MEEVSADANSGFVFLVSAVWVRDGLEDEFGGKELMAFGVGDGEWSILVVGDEYAHVDQGLNLFANGGGP